MREYSNARMPKYIDFENIKVCYKLSVANVQITYMHIPLLLYYECVNV